MWCYRHNLARTVRNHYHLTTRLLRKSQKCGSRLRENVLKRPRPQPIGSVVEEIRSGVTVRVVACVGVALP